MQALLPDLILGVGAMLLLLYAAWGKESLEREQRVGVMSILLCVATGAVIVWLATSGAKATAGVIAVDNFRWATDLIVLLATLITIVLALDYSRREGLVVA